MVLFEEVRYETVRLITEFQLVINSSQSLCTSKLFMKLENDNEKNHSCICGEDGKKISLY